MLIITIINDQSINQSNSYVHSFLNDCVGYRQHPKKQKKKYSFYPFLSVSYYSCNTMKNDHTATTITTPVVIITVVVYHHHHSIVKQRRKYNKRLQYKDDVHHLV
eukprot:TRINITY_DN696_c0_g1_i7.p1 TRINITY_DN696_c0_g1~~TRINITY_DN696_c0_g1_i7.p1  ORF type:complete len:105 (+),score=12.58 TRINITY_DN696_c0_g1_i7:74-388(+)